MGSENLWVPPSVMVKAYCVPVRITQAAVSPRVTVPEIWATAPVICKHVTVHLKREIPFGSLSC